MNYKALKYTILTIILIFSILLMLPFGDYCFGLVEVLWLIILWSLFGLGFVLFLIKDLISYTKYKLKFDIISIVFLFVFVSVNWFLLENKNEKFWLKKSFVGNVIVEENEVGKLILYDNGTFDLKTIYIEWSCIYTGSYLLRNDTLKLERNDIESLTDNIFTSIYYFNKEEGCFSSFSQKFKRILLE